MEEVYIGLLGKPGFESKSNPQIRHNFDATLNAMSAL